MYVCNYNNVRVRKYISLSIPLVHNSWAARSVSQVSIQLHFLPGEIDNTSCEILLYFPRCENETTINFYTFLDIENETSINFYTFLGVRTRQ